MTSDDKSIIVLLAAFSSLKNLSNPVIKEKGKVMYKDPDCDEILSRYKLFLRRNRHRVEFGCLPRLDKKLRVH